MTKAVANVSISTDTFAGWVGKTNILLDALANEIVTVNGTAFGSNSAGNGSIIGILAANVLSTPVLRGGASGNTANVQTLSVGWSNSTVSSNVVITGYTANVTANTLNISSNVSVTGANVIVSTTNAAVSSANLTLSGGQLNITSNVNATGANTTITTGTVGTLTVTGNTFVNTNILFNGNNSIIAQTANTFAFPTDGTTANTIYSIPKALAKSGKLSISIADTTTINANNRMFTEISFVYFDNGVSNTVYFNEYGMIFNNTRFMTFSMTTDATNINLTAVSNTTVTSSAFTISSTLHK